MKVKELERKGQLGAWECEWDNARGDWDGQLNQQVSEGRNSRTTDGRDLPDLTAERRKRLSAPSFSSQGRLKQPC